MRQRDVISGGCDDELTGRKVHHAVEMRTDAEVSRIAVQDDAMGPPILRREALHHLERAVH
jgi:hypothetical protein